MTIYYLMVKTHKITGLKYLCQTTKIDPHEYLGSGKYWRLHLRKHGTDITTEIIKECESKDEVKSLGKFKGKGNATRGKVTVTDQFGRSKTILKEMYDYMKLQMTSSGVGMADWEYVTIGSPEDKIRRNR